MTDLSAEKSTTSPGLVALPRHEPTLPDVLAIARRRFLIAALTFLAVFSAVSGFVYTREPVYEARALVTLRTPRNGQLFPAVEGEAAALERRAEDEIAYLQSDATGAALAADGVVVTAQGTVVGSPFSTELVFTATGPDRGAVVENANRWANSYLTMRSDELIAGNDALIVSLNEQRAAVSADREALAEPLDEIDREFSLATTAEETLRLSARREALERSIGSELEALRRRETELYLQTVDRQIVQRDLDLVGVSARLDQLAERASDPSGDPIRNVALGSVLALTSALAAAALFEVFDPKVRTGPLTGRASTVPVVGRLRRDTSAASESGRPDRRDLDRMFANVALSLPPPPGSIVVVASASDNDPATSVAALLALEAADDGFTTLALDAWTTKPGLLGLGDLDGAPSDLGAAPIGTHHPNLWILHAFSPDAPAPRMSANGALRRVVDAAGGHDVTVIDAPPLIGERADSLLLAGSAADVVLLVVVPGTTRRRDLDVAIDRLRFAGVEHLGIVIDETARSEPA